MKYLEEIAVAIDNEITLFTNSWDPAHLRVMDIQRRKRALSLSFIADGLNYCCGVATQEKLDSMVMTSEELKIRMNKIGQSLEQTLGSIGQGSKKLEEVQRANNRALKITENRIKLLENYTNTINNAVVAESIEQRNLLVAFMRSNTDTAKKIIRLTRSIKNQGVVQNCRQKQIPASIIEPHLLRADLEDLQSILAGQDQELTISVQDLSTYYRLPISELKLTFEDVLTKLSSLKEEIIKESKRVLKTKVPQSES
ncbi:unnamed protein product [Ceutorhynchus assimilis]|uniref:Uncharacterized protein n=1 Tax=Ceutorhynchus assimilis TaxID=467358 RepID=A0A9N9MLF2_9CUCU|nr:unnamed protein product [Ceutorhynchus assimilis]